MNALDKKMDIDKMRRSAAQAGSLLKALANPDRLLLMCHLSQGEHWVGELEAVSGIAQPTLSQQLGVLRDEGLVATRRNGKQVLYRIASKAALAVMQVLYEQFCQSGKVTNEGEHHDRLA